MSGKSLPTVDEIINTLKRSYIPTILIEGTDDVFVYRWLKSKLDASLVSLQACGGRNNLFSIFDRKAEFSGKNVIFVADKDFYKFDGVPAERSSIIYTSGYCIENDIFEGSGIKNFIDEEDWPEHNLLRDIVGRWFSFQVGIYLERRSIEQANFSGVSTHINVISPIGLRSICPNHARNIGYAEPESEVKNMIFDSYNLNVRGKQLFQMLSRFLSKKGRFSNFTDKNLVEIALKQGANTLIDRLVEDINSMLNTKIN